MCWRLVHRTIHHGIENHWDMAGAVCPASSAPYRITLGPKPKQKDVAA